MAQASFIGAHQRYHLPFFFFFLPKLGDMIQIFLRHTIFLSKLLFPSSYLEVIDPMLISL